MLILTIRTDKPEAELNLYDDKKYLHHIQWMAHRELAETIHKKMKELLALQGGTLQDIRGLVVYRGPGSFTGLRIGIAVANAMADSLGIGIVGTSSEDWKETGIAQLLEGESDGQVTPEYGSEAHITLPKR